MIHRINQKSKDHLLIGLVWFMVFNATYKHYVQIKIKYKTDSIVGYSYQMINNVHFGFIQIYVKILSHWVILNLVQQWWPIQ